MNKSILLSALGLYCTILVVPAHANVTTTINDQYSVIKPGANLYAPSDVTMYIDTTVTNNNTTSFGYNVEDKWYWSNYTAPGSTAYVDGTGGSTVAAQTTENHKWIFPNLPGYRGLTASNEFTIFGAQHNVLADNWYTVTP